ncbi:voltage-dependent anion channel [Hygrophoropsis aurantiaca]|uniref:Voltage-dependent anion channel n=1 Tax=Hygrophoropsis aurantiaca TaxID=72124 RepID=A0ACB8AN24_9AGAM|nr:voltage-dependent anion channel [Hygrophoropsis aurantiaca]
MVPKRSAKSWKECIRHFTWAWHTVIMGTGATAAVVHAFPYGHESLAIKVVTLLLFFLNLLLFVIICSATIARYMMFPQVWSIMLQHPTHSLFIGTFPMGAVTIINIALVINQEWAFGGTGFLYTLWGLWWLDCLVSYAIVFGMLYVMMTKQKHTLSKMAAVWLLPVVTLIVASSTGGLLSAALKPHSFTMALFTTCFSLTMVIIGLSLALMMITVYLTRLILHGPPDITVILSAFMILGPLGQGGYSFLINGQNLSELLPIYQGDDFPMSPLTGQMLYAVCFCASYILWSMGICWFLVGLCSTISMFRKQGIVPFSMSYWGLVFPNGVYAMLSVQLGTVLNSDFFRVFGAIWSAFVFLLWFSIFVRTIPAILDTSIFNAPYLAATPSLLPFAEKQGDSESTDTSTYPNESRTSPA